MIITKRFRFEAAHRLPRYEGPCFHLHGPSYELHVSLEMPINPETGMTLDFFLLENSVREKVLSRLDHQDINKTLENPTAENIAVWIWEQLKPDFPALAEIRLFETPDSSVTYRGSGEGGMR